jgi:hypothetical protein
MGREVSKFRYSKMVSSSAVSGGEGTLRQISSGYSLKLPMSVTRTGLPSEKARRRVAEVEDDV